MIVLLVISVLLVAWVDIIAVFKKKHYKEGFISIILYGVAITFCLVIKIQVPPTPLKIVTFFVQPVSKGILAIFQ